jgi:hypothetical protein
MASPRYPSCVSATLCVVASAFHSQTFNRSVWGPLISSNSLSSTEQQALSWVNASYCVGLFTTGTVDVVAAAYYDGTSWSGQSVIGYPDSFQPLVCRTTTFRAVAGRYVTVGTR